MGRIAFVMVMLVMGCASQAVRTARDEAEIERLKLENEYLRKRVEQGVDIEGSNFSARLPANANPAIVKQLTSREAAEAGQIHMQTELARNVASSASMISRDETPHHFWFDKYGRKWARGYFINRSQYTITGFETMGIYGDFPDKLLPGGIVDSLWALAGSRIYISAKKLDSKNKVVGYIKHTAEISFMKIRPVEVINDKAYQWRTIQE